MNHHGLDETALSPYYGVYYGSPSNAELLASIPSLASSPGTPISPELHYSPRLLTVDPGGNSPSPPGDLNIPEFMTTSLPLYDIAVLHENIQAMRDGLAHNPAALFLLNGMVRNMESGFWVDDAHADSLLISEKNLYFCPCYTCPKNRDGYDRIERARDHIWARHLGRYYQCLWDRCSSTFVQEDGWKVHVNTIHLGRKQKPTCLVCSKAVSSTYNLNRHMQAIHNHTIKPRTRNSVDRLRY